MIRIAWVAAIVLATLSVLVLLWQFSLAVILFLLSLAVAAAFRPLINALVQRGLKRPLALAASYGVVLFVFVGLVVVSSGLIVADFQDLVDDSLQAYERAKAQLKENDNQILPNISTQLPPSAAIYDILIDDQTGLVLQTLFGAAEGTMNFATRLTIVVALSFYWSSSYIHFERLWLSLMPVASRHRIRKLWHRIETGVGEYLRREVTLSMLSSVSLWLGLSLLEVNYAAILSLAGAVIRLIPWLGPIFMLVGVFLASSEIGLWASLVAAGYTLLVFMVFETRLKSVYFSDQRYSPLLLVIIAIMLADTYGLVGALLAPILSVALQIGAQNLLPEISASLGKVGQTADDAVLKSKIKELSQMAQAMNGPGAAETVSLVSRLEKLYTRLQKLILEDEIG